MIQKLLSKLSKFKQQERGAVLVLVAFCILPLMLMLGLAVDTSYGLAQKRKLQMATDAAAKAAAANGNGDASAIAAEAQKVFAVNTTNMTGISGPNVSYNASSQSITVSASITVPTFFMNIGGIPSATYSATSSASSYGYGASEVALVFDLSNTNGNWTSKMITALQYFITGLPSTTKVSIVPITSGLSLDPATTNPNALFNHLSNTTNDESSNPALYVLSNNYAWNSTNYGSVYNYLYGGTFPLSTSYYPLPGTCTGWGGPGTYQACSALYPLLCSVGHTSCRANYSYTNTQTRVSAILPLTANRTILATYLNNLQYYSTSNHDNWPSLIIWGWRAIAPEWKDFWLVNEDATSTARTSGKFPSGYSKYTPKNIVLVVTGGTTWNASSLANTYNSLCGAGLTKWQLSYYGILPLTSDRSAYLDTTCDNYNYKTVDQALGLNLTTTNYYVSNLTSTQYATSIVNELNNKFLRICSNIKAQGISIYVVTQNDDPNLQLCASGTTAPFYQVTGNGVPSINISATNVTTSIAGPLAFQQ